jgi:hypothetical protein
MFEFPVRKTWEELKQFWFARSDPKTWFGRGAALVEFAFLVTDISLGSAL